MKIRNSTPWPEFFLRRMTTWCAQQLDFSTKRVKLAFFRNSRSAWSGGAHWPSAITVCVGSASHFPTNTVRGDHFGDREDCLVEVTAHELAHLAQGSENVHTRRRGGWGGSENGTEALARPILAKFKQERAALLPQWLIPPVCALRAAPMPLAKRREAKAKGDLARWQTRLKLAQTKVRKLKTRVRYYERKHTTQANEAIR